VLLEYSDAVVNIIRRGDFKKLDQEVETGWKRGVRILRKAFCYARRRGYTLQRMHSLPVSLRKRLNLTLRIRRK